MSTPMQKRLQPRQAFAREHGFITLVAVLVFAAVGLAIGTSLLLSGVDASRTNAILWQSLRAREFATYCAEEALEKLKENIYYSGDETLLLSGGSCEIKPISGNGNTSRTIEVVGVVGDVVRKIAIRVETIHPSTTLSSWKEVADF